MRMEQNQNLKNKKSIPEQPFLIIFISILTIILGFIVDFCLGYMQWLSLFFALGLIVLIFLIINYYNNRFFYKPIVDLTDEINSKIDRLVSPENIEWLYTSEQLADLESKINVPLIWLISSDLDEDIIGGIFQQIVNENLNRNIIYKYFIPDTPDIHSKVE